MSSPRGTTGFEAGNKRPNGWFSGDDVHGPETLSSLGLSWQDFFSGAANSSNRFQRKSSEALDGRPKEHPWAVGEYAKNLCVSSPDDG